VAVEDPHRADHYLNMAESALKPLLEGGGHEDVFSVCAVVEYKRYRLRFDPEWRGEGPTLAEEEPPDALFRRVPTLAQAREVFDSLVAVRRFFSLLEEGGCFDSSVRALKAKQSALLAPTDEALAFAGGGGYAAPAFMEMWARVVRGSLFLAVGEGGKAEEELRRALAVALREEMDDYRGTIGMIYTVQQMFETARGGGFDTLATQAWMLLKGMGGCSTTARRLADAAESQLEVGGGGYGLRRWSMN
jgi:hypothetical protein